MIKGDFRRFEGSWRLQALPDGTSLLYDLTVQGCMGMPVGLIEQRCALIYRTICWRSSRKPCAVKAPVTLLWMD